MTDLADTKKRLRAACLAQRPAIAAAAGRVPAARALCDRVLAHVPVRADAVWSGFWPVREEIDPLPLLTAVAEAGGRAALPVVAGRDAPLLFRRWRPDMDLQAGAFGIREPGPDAPEVVPDVVLVPLLAFDRAGGRLGYGGGFYDRTLSALRLIRSVTAIGVAYAGQELPEVPEEAHDEPLDAIATEHEIIQVNRRKDMA